MQRMVISLTENDKIWLAKRAKTEHKSIAEVIRQAIHCFQEQHERKQMAKKQRNIILQSRRCWNNGDGLHYQQNIRNEWE